MQSKEKFKTKKKEYVQKHSLWTFDAINYCKYVTSIHQEMLDDYKAILKNGLVYAMEYDTNLKRTVNDFKDKFQKKIDTYSLNNKDLADCFGNFENAMEILCSNSIKNVTIMQNTINNFSEGLYDECTTKSIWNTSICEAMNDEICCLLNEIEKNSKTYETKFKEFKKVEEDLQNIETKYKKEVSKGKLSTKVQNQYNKIKSVFRYGEINYLSSLHELYFSHLMLEKNSEYNMNTNFKNIMEDYYKIINNKMCENLLIFHQSMLKEAKVSVEEYESCIEKLENCKKKESYDIENKFLSLQAFRMPFKNIPGDLNLPIVVNNANMNYIYSKCEYFNKKIISSKRMIESSQKMLNSFTFGSTDKPMTRDKINNIIFNSKLAALQSETTINMADFCLQNIKKAGFDISIPDTFVPKSDFLPIFSVDVEDGDDSGSHHKIQATVLYSYTPTEAGQIEVQESQSVVFCGAIDGWAKIETSTGASGYVPESYLLIGKAPENQDSKRFEIQNYEVPSTKNDSRGLDTYETPRFDKATVLYDFEACEAHEVSVKCDDVVIVTNTEEGGWIQVKTMSGKVGIVPMSYLQF